MGPIRRNPVGLPEGCDTGLGGSPPCGFGEVAPDSRDGESTLGPDVKRDQLPLAHEGCHRANADAEIVRDFGGVEQGVEIGRLLRGSYLVTNDAANGIDEGWICGFHRHRALMVEWST